MRKSQRPCIRTHIESGYHLQRRRSEAEFLLAHFPDKYRPANGPDNIADDDGPWSIYDEHGDIIDTNGPLEAEAPREEDRARILAYHASTTEAERRADRQAIWARQRRVLQPLRIPAKPNTDIWDKPEHPRRHLSFEVKRKRLLVSRSGRHFSTLFEYRYSARAS